MYADDTVLLLKHKDEEELNISSHIAVSMAKQYCHENDLILNEGKTKQIIFGNKYLKNTGLPDILLAEEIKYLGIKLDRKLVWTPNIESLCSKLSSAIYVIKKIKSITNTETARVAYFALFNSLLTYGICIWGYSSENNMKKVLILQKRAIRILSESNQRDSCRPIFKKMKIQTAVAIFVIEVVMYVAKKEIPKLKNAHNYQTRNRHNYNVIPHRLSLFEKSPAYIGKKIFNILPEEIKFSTDIKQLKKKLCNWLIEESFYSIKEVIHWSNNGRT